MRINIILPGLSLTNNVAGGAKVVYQYANYLSGRGHDVCIYFDLLDGDNDYGVPRSIMRAVKKRYLKFNKSYPNWFNIGRDVKRAVCEINNDNVRNADMTIATAYTTVNKVANLSVEKGVKTYFIQDFENWDGVSDEDVFNSYKMPLEKIVISGWLKKAVDKYSSTPSYLVPNGCDDEIFKVKKAIDVRHGFSIAYLYSEDERKGCKYGLRIIEKLCSRYPEMKVYVFGHPSRPKQLADNVSYVQNATEFQVSKMLNDSAVYMCTSLAEGFGLPGLEAMLCGCALVSTRTKGVYEYANDDVALLSDIEDEEAMFKNICELFDDSERRVALAERGNLSVQDKKLLVSCEKFEGALKDILERSAKW